MGAGMNAPDRRADADIKAEWARVRGRLRAEFGEATYRSWLKPLTLKDVDSGCVSVSVPTRFVRDWVAQNYADRIAAVWNQLNTEVRRVEVVVDAARPAEDRISPKAGAVAKSSSEIEDVPLVESAPRYGDGKDEPSALPAAAEDVSDAAE